jgi:putative sterol carrier protein
MTTLLAPTTEELFVALRETVDANPNDLKSKFNAQVEFHIENNNSVEAAITLDIWNNNNNNATPKEKPDLIVHVSMDVFHQMLNKKMTPQQAFMKRKLKIVGNMGLALKMTLVLNATRKTLLDKKSTTTEASLLSKL